jgi:hypothetical protein
MATQNQGNAIVATRSFGYDNPSYLTRQSYITTVNSAGSASATGKFYAHANLILWGVTFCTVAAGTSTYTVNGTATTSCSALYALYVTNTNTTGTAVTLGTTTLGAAATGPFFVGSTTTTGTNVNVGGIGGIAGGYQGPYSLNTLGGTNTSMVWGTNTFVIGSATTGQTSVSPYGGGNAGQGGLPMNAGDVLYFVNGTDATFTTIPIIHYSLAFGATVPA